MMSIRPWSRSFRIALALVRLHGFHVDGKMGRDLRMRADRDQAKHLGSRSLMS
jgi:hypothetical protein